MVTGPNVTKFVCNIRKSLPFNIFKSELRSFNLFWNAGATNQGGILNFDFFPLPNFLGLGEKFSKVGFKA